MTLSKAQLRIVQDWLRDYVRSGCPSCGCKSFSLDPKLQALIAFPENSGQMGITESTPVLALTCRICANMRFFSAASILAGMRGRDESKEQRDPSLVDEHEAISI